MAETPIEQLQKLRIKIVEERRQAVSNMLEMTPSAFMNDFMRYQTAVEVIDRAIADEKGLPHNLADKHQR